MSGGSTCEEAALRLPQLVDLDENALFGRRGLIEHLTPQRANGLRSMIARIKQEAQTALSDAA